MIIQQISQVLCSFGCDNEEYYRCQQELNFPLKFSIEHAPLEN